MLVMLPVVLLYSSPSSRRAWIEIPNAKIKWQSVTVALLAEGVDRNFMKKTLTSLEEVALLAEGVDRNCWPVLYAKRKSVSPSSRRAWIEIQLLEGPEQRHHVALLAEGVDRNRFR